MLTSRTSSIATGSSMSCVMECFCLAQQIWMALFYYPSTNLLSQSTGREKLSTSSCHFWRPGHQHSWRSLMTVRLLLLCVLLVVIYEAFGVISEQFQQVLSSLFSLLYIILSRKTVNLKLALKRSQMPQKDKQYTEEKWGSRFLNKINNQ